MIFKGAGFLISFFFHFRCSHLFFMAYLLDGRLLKLCSLLWAPRSIVSLVLQPKELVLLFNSRSMGITNTDYPKRDLDNPAGNSSEKVALVVAW